MDNEKERGIVIIGDGLNILSWESIGINATGTELPCRNARIDGIHICKSQASGSAKQAKNK